MTNSRSTFSVFRGVHKKSDKYEAKEGECKQQNIIQVNVFVV